MVQMLNTRLPRSIDRDCNRFPVFISVYQTENSARVHEEGSDQNDVEVSQFLIPNPKILQISNSNEITEQ
jgi:hypothetical protein